MELSENPLVAVLELRDRRLSKGRVPTWLALFVAALATYLLALFLFRLDILKDQFWSESAYWSRCELLRRFFIDSAEFYLFVGLPLSVLYQRFSFLSGLRTGRGLAELLGTGDLVGGLARWVARDCILRGLPLLGLVALADERVALLGWIPLMAVLVYSLAYLLAALIVRAPGREVVKSAQVRNRYSLAWTSNPIEIRGSQQRAAVTPGGLTGLLFLQLPALWLAVAVAMAGGRFWLVALVAVCTQFLVGIRQSLPAFIREAEQSTFDVLRLTRMSSAELGRGWLMLLSGPRMLEALLLSCLLIDLGKLQHQDPYEVFLVLIALVSVPIQAITMGLCASTTLKRSWAGRRLMGVLSAAGLLAAFALPLALMSLPIGLAALDIILLLGSRVCWDFLVHQLEAGRLEPGRAAR